MKIRLALLLAAISGAAWSQASSVSNLSLDGLSHSAVRISFTASSQFYWMRVRYIQAPGTCTSGTGGTIQSTSYSNYNFGALHVGAGNTVTVAGLQANTNYQACPEISSDSNNWSNGAGIAFTTQPLPDLARQN